MSYPEEWIHIKVEAVRFFRPLLTIYQISDITSQKTYSILKFIRFDNYFSFNRPTHSELRNSYVPEDPAQVEFAQAGIECVYTVELHLTGRWLSESPISWTSLLLRISLSRFLQN